MALVWQPSHTWKSVLSDLHFRKWYLQWNGRPLSQRIFHWKEWTDSKTPRQSGLAGGQCVWNTTVKRRGSKNVFCSLMEGHWASNHQETQEWKTVTHVQVAEMSAAEETIGAIVRGVVFPSQDAVVIPSNALHTCLHSQWHIGKGQMFGENINSSFLFPLHGDMKMTAIHLWVCCSYNLLIYSNSWGSEWMSSFTEVNFLGN